MLGIAHNHPRDTVKVLVVQTGQIVNRQNVSWHPGTVPGGPISPTPAGDNSTAEPVGVRGSTMEAHTPTQPAQEAEEESEPILEPETVPAAVRKLTDHFTGELPSVIHGRTRNTGGVDSRARSVEIDKDLPHSVAYIGRMRGT